MTRHVPSAPSRRHMLTWMTVTPLTVSTAFAVDSDEIDPTDTVPRRFSVRSFTALDGNQIYDVNLAVRRGRTIVIDGYSPSQSRQIILDAARDWPGTRARLLQRR